MRNVEILETVGSNRVLLSCALCKGSGRKPGHVSSTPCDICSGKGVVLFYGAPPLVPCRLCEGSGNKPGYVSYDPCDICGGAGALSLGDMAGEGGAKVNRLEAFWELVHPKIKDVAYARFESGHFADAVEAAFKELNSVVKATVRDAIGEELDGARLMSRAFSLEKPIITLSDTSTESGKNTQVGYLNIFSGAMTGVRNPKAHANVYIDKLEAIHLLFLASLLMLKLEAQIRLHQTSQNTAPPADGRGRR